MKRLKSIEFVAQGAGYFKVLRDGQQVSQHTGIHKAQERATNEKILYPESDVWYEQSLRVECNARFDDYEEVQVKEVTSGETVVKFTAI